MFGHQDDLAYGVGWKYVPGRSDVKEACGDYPAMYGWDISGLEYNSANNGDGVPFKKMKQFIREGYARGGVITLSWHPKSPLEKPKGAWDTTHGTVATILPGGANHDTYKLWLDEVASFIGSLKGNQGEPIPVLFRPFHELTGSWFWWGKNECSPAELITLYRFTVYYLNHEKNLHNILWVYNTAGDLNTAQDFLERYPGDDVVDILSCDNYQYDDPQTSKNFINNTSRALDILETIAQQKGKLFALAETGYEAIPYADWWTHTLLNAIGDHKVAYVLVWRNHGYNEQMKKMHYYAPYKGQASEADFKKFYDLPKTLFEKDISIEHIYGSS